MDGKDDVARALESIGGVLVALSAAGGGGGAGEPALRLRCRRCGLDEMLPAAETAGREAVREQADAFLAAHGHGEPLPDIETTYEDVAPQRSRDMLVIDGTRDATLLDIARRAATATGLCVADAAMALDRLARIRNEASRPSERRLRDLMDEIVALEAPDMPEPIYPEIGDFERPSGKRGQRRAHGTQGWKRFSGWRKR